ncbi:MAG TPA: hypothetical protein VHM26_11135 [Chitinophagaceae bacterium]|jgi:hypothetical protein|nr:hypothetical protein [Chitinophagaceae bacterium]
MDLLQQTSQGFSDFRWQDWLFMIFGIGCCAFMIFVSPKMYAKAMKRFEIKHNVSIKATFRSYKLTGPHHWTYLLWLELKLMFTMFIIYFFPLVMIGLVGLVLGVFTT